jgi:hypothetical protein
MYSCVNVRNLLVKYLSPGLQAPFYLFRILLWFTVCKDIFGNRSNHPFVP